MSSVKPPNINRFLEAMELSTEVLFHCSNFYKTTLGHLQKGSSNELGLSIMNGAVSLENFTKFYNFRECSINILSHSKAFCNKKRRSSRIFYKIP